MSQCGLSLGRTLPCPGMIALSGSEPILGRCLTAGRGGWDSSFTIFTAPPHPCRVGTSDFWKCCRESLSRFPNRVSLWAFTRVSETGKTLGFSGLWHAHPCLWPETCCLSREGPETRSVLSSADGIHPTCTSHKKPYFRSGSGSLYQPRQRQSHV